MIQTDKTMNGTGASKNAPKKRLGKSANMKSGGGRKKNAGAVKRKNVVAKKTAVGKRSVAAARRMNVAGTAPELAGGPNAEA